MRFGPTTAVFITGLFIATASQSATFVVPSDEELISRADAIVSGTCIDSRSQADPLGNIETVYRISVDEILAGDVFETLLDVHEPGGTLDESWLRVSGSPTYEIGQRYVLFLERGERAWRTSDMVLGQFRYVVDERDREYLLRDATEINGSHSSGEPYRESYRSAAPFRDYVRAVARGESAVASYLTSEPALTGQVTAQEAPDRLIAGSQFVFALNQRPARRPHPSDEWRAYGWFESLDILDAVRFGTSVWTDDPESDVDYEVATVPATGRTWGDDGEARIVANDPDNQIPGRFGVNSSVIAAAYSGCSNCSEHMYNGAGYASITFADIIVNDGVSGSTLSQHDLRTAVAHELGHTLGFRHSNRDRDGGACGINLPCSDRAVMSSWVSSFAGGSLEPWDIAALRSVYGNGTLCEIQPISLPGDRIVITRGQPVTLSIDIFTPMAATFQWFEGKSGDSSMPVGTSSRHLMLGSVFESRSFWVRVANGCDTWDSHTITVAVHSGRRRGARG